MKDYTNSLDLDFAGWFWAISRNKAKEYYAYWNVGATEFKNWIGGAIVSRFFQENAELLRKAYLYLHSGWTTTVWSLYGSEQSSIFEPRVSLNFQEISWMLFKSLAYSLEVKYLDKWVDGNWRSLWAELDERFLEDDEEGGE